MKLVPLAPWQATSPALGAALILACAAFAIASISVAVSASGLVRVVFGAFALVALSLVVGELWLLTSPFTTVTLGLQDVSTLELAVAIAALNGMLALYGNYTLAAQRLTAEELRLRITSDERLKASLEKRLAA